MATIDVRGMNNPSFNIVDFVWFRMHSTMQRLQGKLP